MSPHAFSVVLDQVTLALEEIDRITHPTRSARPSWAVTRTDWSAGSGPVVVLSPTAPPKGRTSEDISRPATALVEGVMTLGELPEIPDGFSQTIIERITTVRNQIERPERGLGGVSLISVNGARSQPAPVSEAVGRNARAAVASASYAYGSLVGVLDVISARRSKARIGLLPDHGPAVICSVDQLPREQVLAAFDHRVLVGGLLRRNGRGQAVRLEVDHLELLPPGQPVTARELLRAAPDLGGQLTAAEYVARQRGRG